MVFVKHIHTNGGKSDETEAEAQCLLEMTIPVMTNAAGITETLKPMDSMKWVGLMNAVKAQAEEITWKVLNCM